MARKPTAPTRDFKVPKTLGACADALYTARQERLSEQKHIAEFEAFEKLLKEKFINELPKSDALGVTGKVARVQVAATQIPSVTDWEALYKFILKHKRFDLLQRRVNEQAVQEMWDAGKKVPGVEPFGVVKVSCTKI